MDLSWIKISQMVNIVEMAAQLILQVYIGSFEVIEKDDKSPLTLADKKANDYICAELKSLYPEIPIISEENKNDDYETRKNYTFCWLVDPLDGTKEFIKRNGQFTVNIGLSYLGKPVAGFVNIPCSMETYFAVSGKGAFYRENGGETIRITDLRDGRDSEITRVIASNSHLNEETRRLIASMGKVELKNVGSSIKILWIAENKADIYPRIAPTMEWDTCATHAILNEVGGVILKYPELEEELTYNKSNLLNPFFIAQMSNSTKTPKWSDG